MGNCLVTKLTASVNNDELYKLNELRFKYLTSGAKIELKAISSTNIVSIGGDMTIDGINVGSSYVLLPNVTKSIYCPNGTTISLDNKFNLSRISMDIGTSVDCSRLGYNKDLTCIPSGTAITTNFKYFQGLYLSFSKLNISGDISDIKDVILNYCDKGASVIVPGLSGNLECLLGITKSLPTPEGFTTFNDKFTGDIINIVSTSSTKMLTGQWFYMTNLSGDISTAKSSLYYLSISSTMTWKNTRPSSYPIIMLSAVNLGEDVDNMLINQSQCVMASDLDYTDRDIIRKNISVFGTHTPSTQVNAAIKILIGYGISVKVNNVILTGDEL